jgi:signal transduction histidine kinase
MKNFSRQGDDEREMTDIHHTIDTALNIAKNEIKYKAVVKKSYADLPDIFCSPSQMNQIFLNLLVNAAQAIPDHGVIQIKTELFDDVIQIEIEDDGVGMDEKEISKIFDTFYTTKPVGEGTGLGLPIVRDIITRHGGEISVRSVLGEGTCFEIRLPIKQEQDQDQENYIEGAA